jgi:hypothetical protein
MDAFSNANPGWKYSWAAQADMAKVEQGITILNYDAWVVSMPAVTAGDGSIRPSRFPGPDDVGGAVFNLKYTPVPGAHAFTDLHWIQAYYGSEYGGASYTALDNPFANGTPFYDDGGAAGQLAGGGGWFLDRPYNTEGEYEQNPVASFQFQVVLADYTAATKSVTLYGGEWWGFQYFATDVPEPSVFALIALGFVWKALGRKYLTRT